MNQVGTNIWVGGQFTQVKQRNGTRGWPTSQTGGLHSETTST
jgi:hypothetical protein